MGIPVVVWSTDEEDESFPLDGKIMTLGEIWGLRQCQRRLRGGSAIDTSANRLEVYLNTLW